MKIERFWESKTFWQFLAIGLLIMCMASCTSTNTLHYSGKYKVIAVQGDTVRFKGISSPYLIVGNEFKIGQRIALKRTWNKSKVNVLLTVKK